MSCDCCKHIQQCNCLCLVFSLTVNFNTELYWTLRCLFWKNCSLFTKLLLSARFLVMSPILKNSQVGSLESQGTTVRYFILPEVVPGSSGRCVAPWAGPKHQTVRQKHQTTIKNAVTHVDMPQSSICQHCTPWWGFVDCLSAVVVASG